MLGRYFELGGVMMWPLLGCSVLLTAVLLERLWTIVILGKLLRRSADRFNLTWHRRVMPFFTEVPPSIGLLGTVIGVVRSFSLTNGRITAETAASGLGIACFTTIVGLGIAIVASVSGYALTWLGGDIRNSKEEHERQ